MIVATTPTKVESGSVRRPRGGRPTRAAAAERDERLLEIATAMFMDLGFDATSMDRLAEAAAIGKATLYARYSDKAALFADVLKRRILFVYEPLEEEFAVPVAGADLGDVLLRLSFRLIEKGLSPEAVALGRILSAQGPNFPDLAHLAIKEGVGRQMRLIEHVLTPYAANPRYDLQDVSLSADLFLSLVIGRAARMKIYGIAVQSADLEHRTEAAVRLFMRGIMTV